MQVLAHFETEHDHILLHVFINHSTTQIYTLWTNKIAVY